jgi:hypothetical protein
VATLLSAIYGCGLFLWWWIKKGGASSVFAYVTFIFLGEVVESSMSLFARVLWLSCTMETHAKLMSSLFWPARKLVTLGALLFIVIHMSWRAVRKLGRGEKRRETD